MALTIRERLFSWTEQYDVYDENGNAKYHVEGELFSLGHRLHVSDLRGNELIFIKQNLFSFLHRFEIYLQGDFQGYVQERFTLFHPKLDIDYLNCSIEGDVFDWSYVISKNGQLIGTVQRKILSWANVYFLDCPDLANELIVLALSLAADAVHHDHRSTVSD